MNPSAPDPGRPAARPTGPVRPRRAVRAVRALWILAAILAVTVPALANGGIVRISRAPIGPWLVTVYSSPTPLRTGEVDISTLVQDSADAIVDVPIAVHAAPVGFIAETVLTPATRAQATNKLFKAAKFDIGTAGRWEFSVRVGSAATPADGGTTATDDTTAGPERTAPDTAASARQQSAGDGPGGVVSFEAVVNRTTILDRPFLLTVLIALPLLVLGWFLLGREEAAVRDPGAPGKPADTPERG